MHSQGLYGANACVSKSIASITTGGATTYANGAAVVYGIKGKAYSVAIASGVASPTLDGNTGVAFLPLKANQGCVFVWCMDSSGVAQVCQGEINALDASGAFVSAPEFPYIPDTLTPFAYLVIKAISTASAWTFGASNWNATGIHNGTTNSAISGAGSALLCVDVMLGLPDKPVTG